MDRNLAKVPLRTDKELDEDIARLENELQDEQRRLPRVTGPGIEILIGLLAEEGVKAVRVF